MERRHFLTWFLQHAHQQLEFAFESAAFILGIPEHLRSLQHLLVLQLQLTLHFIDAYFCVHEFLFEVSSDVRVLASSYFELIFFCSELLLKFLQRLFLIRAGFLEFFVELLDDFFVLESILSQLFVVFGQLHDLFFLIGLFLSKQFEVGKSSAEFILKVSFFLLVLVDVFLKD